MNDLSHITKQAVLRQRARALPRVISTFMYTKAKGGSLVDEVHRLFQHDKDLHMLARAAVSPMTTQSDSGMWANTVVSDTLNLLAPINAGARVLSAGLQVQLTDHYGVAIADIPTSASNVSWRGEAAPILVGELALSESNVLSRKEMQVILVATRELFNLSQPTWVNIISTSYRESLQLALDAQLFSAAAGDSTKSAGILNGLSGLTKSVKSTEFDAMLEDVQTVAGAVSAVANGNPIILVTGPKRVIKLKMWADRVPFETYGSNAVAESVLIAVATNGLASSVDEVPIMTQSREATLHMDSSPAAISTMATPNAVAAPVRSVYQTDSIACKIALGASWVRRSDSSVAVLTGITAW